MGAIAPCDLDFEFSVKPAQLCTVGYGRSLFFDVFADILEPSGFVVTTDSSKRCETICIINRYDNGPNAVDVRRLIQEGTNLNTSAQQ